MRKILLIGCGGNDNFGDEAMFKEIYKKLSSKGFDITAAYYDFDVKKIKKRYTGVNFIKLVSLPRKLRLLKKIISQKCAIDYDALYIAGGGNLTSLYTGHIENIYFLVNSFRKQNKYVEFRPQSVGPFFGKTKSIDKLYVEKIVNMADEFYVRENVSYEYLKKISKNVKLSCDDAWNIEVIKPENFDVSILENKKLVGISIRPFRTESHYLVKWFDALVDKLIINGYTPFFISICYNEESRECQDNHFLKSTIKNKGIFIEDIIDVKRLQSENIKYFISLCEKCIGLSYHFSVFSLSLNVKLVSLYWEDYYRTKNLGLHEAFGNIENVINPLKIEVKEVIDL